MTLFDKFGCETTFGKKMPYLDELIHEWTTGYVKQPPTLLGTANNI